MHFISTQDCVVWSVWMAIYISLLLSRKCVVYDYHSLHTLCITTWCTSKLNLLQCYSLKTSTSVKVCSASVSALSVISICNLSLSIIILLWKLVKKCHPEFPVALSVIVSTLIISSTSCAVLLFGLWLAWCFLCAGLHVAAKRTKRWARWQEAHWQLGISLSGTSCCHDMSQNDITGSQRFKLVYSINPGR